MPNIQRLALVASVLFAVSASKCPDKNGTDGGTPAPETSGDGTIVVSGQTRQYRVVAGDTHLYIMSRVFSSGLCSQLHHHAVASTVTGFEFALDKDNPSASTLTARANAFGLDPDDPVYRSAFETTQNAPQPSIAERDDIKVSVREQVGADDFPTLVFSASSLTTLDGQGTAQIAVDLRGVQTTVPLTATATWEGEKLIITGTAELDGAPHGIPSGTFADCMDPIMPMDLRLVLEPGGASDGGQGSVDAGQFERTFFSDDGGCSEVGFQSVRDVLHLRCGGCHGTTSRFEGLVPLVEWEDYRYNTPRSRGLPLYLDMVERLEFPLDDGRHMPLASTTQVQDLPNTADDELGQLQAWAEQGGRRLECGQDFPPDAGPAWKRSAQATCVSNIAAGQSSTGICAPTTSYEDVKAVFGTEGTGGMCSGCHNATATEQQGLIALTSLDGGFMPITHAYYQGLTGWQASYLRMCDSSMPPGGGASTAQLDLVGQWISEGSKATTCAGGP
jgi:hypothetical protein